LNWQGILSSLVSALFGSRGNVQLLALNKGQPAATFLDFYLSELLLLRWSIECLIMIDVLVSILIVMDSLLIGGNVDSFIPVNEQSTNKGAWHLIWK